jgi:Xaa-Pro aminopeptidase
VIDAKTYAARRDALRKAATGGILLFLGHRLAPRNYRANVYPFRQHSNVLYYSGIAHPDVALVIGETPGDDRLFAAPGEIDDVVWHGAHDGPAEMAAAAGIAKTAALDGLREHLAQVVRRGGAVRYTPPYQADTVDWLAELLAKDDDQVRAGAARELMRAVAAQRSIKSADEIVQIENALAVSKEMHLAAMRAAKPGVRESDVRAAIERIAIAHDRAQAYNPIVTVRGEVLHNNTYSHTLEAGQLLLNDSGAESPLFYASDITRTFPVTGVYSQAQRDVYEIVLAAQRRAIEALRPGVAYKDVHLLACRVIFDGLKSIGLAKGSTDAAVEAGAHALFFPHGLGHMLGLDVHDMEDLGEDIVGYAERYERSKQFGTAYLRLARPLEAGFVFTVEPGIYFIPALIDRWRAEGRFKDFVCYEALDAYRSFGGIRIEDNVLCTESGARVLGSPIPKTVAEVEAVMAG